MSHQPSSGNGLVYDEKLLDRAPEVTKGQRQEGYDADILKPTPPPPSRSPALDLNEQNADIESGTSPNEKHLAAGGYDPVDHPPKPFWKTTKGLIILAVVALVIIAAAVGGGVGGSVGKHKNNNAVVPASGSSTTGSSTPASAASTSASHTRGEQVPTGSACRGPECSTATPGPTTGGVPPQASTSAGEVPGQPATTGFASASISSPTPGPTGGSDGF
ncbi:hypothetical protein FRC08_018633 [Ceratobasidium sp. 394]|nr:hypothetical protein FRC08_018633 [Ceratobasidium sp. 394]KAG9087508.1 hypothetical protein FS749_002863 [Ceratobasidium sp. UAMH 11750]